MAGGTRIVLRARDLRKFDRLAKKIGSIETAKKTIARAQAEEVIDQIRLGFRGARDPYGRAWQKKKTPDGRKPLHGKTLRLRNGWFVKTVTAEGSTVSSAVVYASPHQRPRRRRGRLKRPRRMMVPSSRMGYGRIWRKAILEATRDAIRDHLRD